MELRMTDPCSAAGLKFQCVELARRYLVVNYNVTFQSVDYAYQIWDIRHVDVSEGVGAEHPVFAASLCYTTRSVTLLMCHCIMLRGYLIPSGTS